MHNDGTFYFNSCEFIKELMKRHTPMQALEEIVYPLLKLFNPKSIDRTLISLVITEQPNHNYSEYYPMAYHILNRHPDFYNDKPKELAAFAWEMAGKLGCNDGTDELFEIVIRKVGKYINYDYLEEVKNNTGASSLAHEVFHNKNSKSRIIPQLLELGANFTSPSNNYNSALDRHFINWSDDLKLNAFELDEDMLNTIKILLTHEKTKNSYIEHLDKYPEIKALGIIQSIQLTLELDKKMPMKSGNFHSMKI
jgi:hypothetical protein